MRSRGRIQRFEYQGHDVPGFHVEQSVRKGLVVPGAVLLGGGWVFSGLTGIGLNPIGFVPIVGPFVLAAQLGANGGTSFLGTLGVAMFAVAGVVQVVGAGLLIAGVALPEFWLERDVGGVHLALVPSPGGAQLTGRF